MRTLMNPHYFEAGAEFPPMVLSAQAQQLADYRRLYDAGTPTPDTTLVVTNFYETISEAWARLLYSQLPTVTGPEQDFLDAVLPAVFKAARVAALNASIYGTGLLVVLSESRVMADSAANWFPFTLAADAGVIQADALAYKFASSDTETLTDRLRVDLYIGGNLMRRIFDYDGATLGQLLSTETRTGLPERTVIPVVHTDTGGVHGKSDYVVLEKPVNAYNQRASDVAAVLTKHVDPILTIPEGLTSVDAEGNVLLRQSKDGRTIPIPEGYDNPEYIVWDAGLEAAEDELARLRADIFTVSRLAKSVAEPGEGGSGNAVSGIALRREALPTIQRLESLRRVHTDALQAALVAMFAFKGVTVQPTAFEIVWPELFADQAEQTDDVLKRQAAGLVDDAEAARELGQ